MSASAYAQRLVAVARGEHSSFAGFLESDDPLRRRIYRTYLVDLAVADPDDELGWNMPSNISSWAWSATFISWCVLAAGARNGEFDLSIRHAKYIKNSIENADSETGVFRARRITEYAPKVGDLICGNRGGGTVTYDQARNLESYNSHGAIVIEFTIENGIRYALTVGGNESDSIRIKKVRLTANGYVKQRSPDPYICVIENLKEVDGSFDHDHVSTHEEAAGAATSLAASFRRHGTFVYDPIATIAEYGSAANVAAAAKRAGMTHVWLRVHGRTAPSNGTRSANQSLVNAFAAQDIACAAWGWCQGENPSAEAALALRETERLGLSDYIADIEPGHNNSEWSASEIASFCKAVRRNLPGLFAVSGFALIDWHEPHLYAAALPYVDAFAPQVYWFNYPNTRMRNQFRRPDGTFYELDFAGAYADLCIDRWTAMMGNTPKPLILTGQAYWGEGDFDQRDAEAKLKEFLAGWSDFRRIAGLNWWHFGAGTGMSHSMHEEIVSADLGSKLYG
ncbi:MULTISPECIES: DUF2272 domain-containing protein [Sinorhizobium]|uniref:DUF2272 domain-containing protein n=1 Tax=Sinorhizobium TaxID=28105 RepID=UPI000BE937E8|nr:MULTISPECIES: DUF2272 domain-containing protein [Sinorhizobium]PDT50839.1 hypothetical protein CO664_24030 [Sinorhizobium sp. NG07B]